jgi:hypothetical protein
LTSPPKPVTSSRWRHVAQAISTQLATAPPVVSQGAFGECLIKRLQIGCPLVEIGQIPPHRDPLIAGKRQSFQPGPTGQAEQLALERRDQVGVQHRMQPVLDPGHLLDDLSSLRHQSPQRFGGLIRHPDLRQKATGMQLGQHRRIDLVSLDLGVRDRAHLQRIGNHHAMHEWLQQSHDPGGVHRRLDHDFIVRSKLSAESNHRIPCELDPRSIAQSPTVKKHCHRKAAVHVESDHPHAALLWLILKSEGGGGATRHLRIRARSAPGQVAEAAT